jgi:hypothetical protein
MQFTVTTTTAGTLGIAQLLQRHADSLWVPEHLDQEQAMRFVTDHFTRQIATELAMLAVSVDRHLDSDLMRNTATRSCSAIESDLPTPGYRRIDKIDRPVSV